MFIRFVLDAIGRFWNWFTAGQNATALGILLTLLVNAVSILVLIRTLRAVNKQAAAADRQAKAAEDQALAARKQTEVSEQQREAGERAAEAAEEQARAAQSLEAVAEAQRLAAEQAAQAARIQSELTRHDIYARLRPILVITTHANKNPTLPDVVFAENHGEGVALDSNVQLRRHPNQNIPVLQHFGPVT